MRNAKKAAETQNHKNVYRMHIKIYYMIEMVKNALKCTIICQ